MGPVCCTPGPRGGPKELLLNKAGSDAEVWGVEGFLEKKRLFEWDFEASKFSNNTSRHPKAHLCKSREV